MYFFTVNLLRRDGRLLVEYIDLLRGAFRQTRQACPFDVLAMVVLPDHLHCLWQLPPGDADNATRWSRIKAAFSRGLPADEYRSRRRLAKGERGIWQRRYWEHLIRSEADFVAHVNYIHANPVKHGHVAQITDWPYSSFHRDMRCGDPPERDLEIVTTFGERP
jgi:putative transposase